MSNKAGIRSMNCLLFCFVAVFVLLGPVSCALNVASVFELYIIDCPFGFL